MAKHYSKNLNEGYLRKLANEIIRRDHLKTSATQIRFMEKWELLNFVAVHGHEEIPDSENPVLLFNMVSTRLLQNAVNGEIDLLEIAKITLAGR